MIAEFGHMKHASYQQVILVDTPLKLTHKWQPLWGGITNSIDAWMKGKDSPASFLLFGGVLHFIIHSEDIYKVEGPEKAAENFRKELVKVKPLVAKYSKIAQVVYKMSDHVQACDFNKIANNDNIDLHNKIAREILAGTGVSLWDSPIPLSDINNEECQLRFKESEKMGDWRCQDPRHIGYLFVEQYLDMLLSDICKDVL
ncbi:hypothetical protein SK128_028145 [Halocaridina rubra]|uniref:Uncharacterized protein n=1 Tax=Halocaridina rubra TaxID=373956 RepID=A0AAN8ZZ58_HALRR